jgi:hypothetical protein
MAPEPDLESERCRVLAALEPRLVQADVSDWRQVSTCLGLHLIGVPDGPRREMRSCSTLIGLWEPLVVAVASAGSTRALGLLVSAIAEHVGLVCEGPAWV